MPTPLAMERRLAALLAYDILDTPPEKQFDDLTQVASFICQTPIALMSLLDENRQWFKSRVGLDATETPIEQAFCLHAIQTPGVMIVEDAQTDSRFSANALVTGAPHIRFYAGAPIVTSDGVALGTLCAIDRRPRELEPAAAAALQALANHAATLLELRKVSAALHAALIEKEEAQAETIELRKFLPICSYCRDVRDDDEYWQHIDRYLAKHQNVALSHSVCPKCYPLALSDLGLAAPEGGTRRPGPSSVASGRRTATQPAGGVALPS